MKVSCNCQTAKLPLQTGGNFAFLKGVKMQFDKAKIIIVLICCFLGASIIGFLLKRDSNLVSKDQTMDNAGKNELQESKAKQNKEALNNAQKDLEAIYDNIDDLEALSGDLIEGDIGDVMDKIWSSREITSDFSDRERIAEVIRQFPITSEIALSEEQTGLLHNCVTEMIFNNGNDNYESYLSFLRESGETLHRHEGEPLPANPWKVFAESLRWNKENRGFMSKWEGLVLEGSNIKIFEAQTSQLPIGKKLQELRGAITTFSKMTVPPISPDDVLKSEGKILMSDVMFFIAHDDSTGGTVWPYIIRCWFDPVYSSWRVKRAVLFRNRRKYYTIDILY